MNANTFLNLSVAQLKRAIVVKEKIDALQEELSGILAGDDASPRRGRPPGIKVEGSTEGKKRRQMSPEARAKIGAAAKKRWAKVREEKR